MNILTQEFSLPNVLAPLPASSYRRFLRFAALLALSCLSVAGCNSDSDDDDDFFNSARVVDLALQDSTIRVGEGTVVAVNFSFDASRVFNDGDSVIVVVRLPAELEYRDGTAEIDGLGGEDDGVGAQVVRCGNLGESYLIFDMDEFDLDQAENPSGDGDAVLTLTVDGIDPLQFGTIEAAANGETSPLFTCGGSFASDEEVSLSVER